MKYRNYERNGEGPDVRDGVIDAARSIGNLCRTIEGQAIAIPLTAETMADYRALSENMDKAFEGLLPIFEKLDDLFSKVGVEAPTSPRYAATRDLITARFYALYALNSLYAIDERAKIIPYIAKQAVEARNFSEDASAAGSQEQDPH